MDGSVVWAAGVDRPGSSGPRQSRKEPGLRLESERAWALPVLAVSRTPPLEVCPWSAAPAIRTEGLTKHFGKVVAVDHLDLQVQPGEIFGFLGPNGAGKVDLREVAARPAAPNVWAGVAGRHPGV